MGSQGRPVRLVPAGNLKKIVLSPLQDQVRWLRFTGPGPRGVCAAGHQPIEPVGGCLRTGPRGLTEGQVPGGGPWRSSAGPGGTLGGERGDRDPVGVPGWVSPEGKPGAELRVKGAPCAMP